MLVFFGVAIWAAALVKPPIIAKLATSGKVRKRLCRVNKVSKERPNMLQDACPTRKKSGRLRLDQLLHGPGILVNPVAEDSGARFTCVRRASWSPMRRCMGTLSIWPMSLPTPGARRHAQAVSETPRRFSALCNPHVLRAESSENAGLVHRFIDTVS